MSGKNYGIYRLEVSQDSITKQWHYEVLIKQEVGGFNAITNTFHGGGYNTEKIAKKKGLEWLTGYLKSQLQEVEEALNTL